MLVSIRTFLYDRLYEPPASVAMVSKEILVDAIVKDMTAVEVGNWKSAVPARFSVVSERADVASLLWAAEKLKKIKKSIFWILMLSLFVVCRREVIATAVHVVSELEFIFLHPMSYVGHFLFLNARWGPDKFLKFEGCLRRFASCRNSNSNMGQQFLLVK